jgi:hypothetical protein
MPPPDLVLDALLYAVLPAALVAAVLTAAAAWLGGAKFAPAGAALGLAGGVLLGGWLRDTLTLEAGTSAWNRLPWAALAALAVGLAARWPRLPRLAGWPLRALAAVAAAWWVVPPEVRSEVTWLPAALAAVMLAEWALLEPLAARPPGGSVPLALALTAFVAATVLICANTARLTDAATVLAAALGGVAVVSWWRRSDAGSAVPGVVVLLPGLLLMGQQTTYSEVPWQAFATAAGAPLVLAVTLLPPLHSWQGTRLHLLRWALLLVPLAIAGGLAVQSGELEFE